MGVARDKIGKVTGNYLLTLLSLIYLYALKRIKNIFKACAGSQLPGKCRARERKNGERLRRGKEELLIQTPPIFSRQLTRSSLRMEKAWHWLIHCGFIGTND